MRLSECNSLGLLSERLLRLGLGLERPLWLLLGLEIWLRSKLLLRLRTRVRSELLWRGTILRPVSTATASEKVGEKSSLSVDEANNGRENQQSFHSCKRQNNYKTTLIAHAKLSNLIQSSIPTDLDRDLGYDHHMLLLDDGRRAARRCCCCRRAPLTACKVAHYHYF